MLKNDVGGAGPLALGYLSEGSPATMSTALERRVRSGPTSKATPQGYVTPGPAPRSAIATATLDQPEG